MTDDLVSKSSDLPPEPPRRRGWLARSVLYAIPLVVLVGVVLLFGRMKAHRTKTDSDYARQHGAPLPVRVYQVDEGPLAHAVPAECTAMPNPLVEMRGRIAGRAITKTHVRLGDHVKKGTLLVSLDDGPERLTIARASAMVTSLRPVVEANQGLLDYFRSVRDQGLGLEREVKQAMVELARSQSDLILAESELASGRAELEYSRVVAPLDGVVVEVKQPGETAQLDTPLAKIANVEPILLECTLPEEKLAFVKKGLPVTARFYSRVGKSFEGTVKEVNALSRAEDRVVIVQAEVENNGELLPGLHGIAEIQNDQRSLRIPSVALINPRSDLAQVFLVDSSNKARLRKISVGASAGGYVEVRDGVANGDRVVVAGQLGLRDGDAVRIGGKPAPGAKK